MLTARARYPFIATPPQVATAALSPPPPPDLVASTPDFHAYPIIGAGGSVYIHGNPPIPPNNTGPGHPLTASTPPPPPYPGNTYIAASRQLPFVRGSTVIASQQPFIPPLGSYFYDIGGTLTPPPIYPRPLLSAQLPNQPYPGSVFSSHGGPAPLPTGFNTPSPLIARESPRPYPEGSIYSRTFFNLPNPILLPTTLVARETDHPPPFPGAIFSTAQHTNTLLQTPPPIIASQAFTFYPPGSVYTAHAQPSNGVYASPVIARESPRPYPEGSVYTTHAQPANGVYVPPLIAVESPRPYPLGSSFVTSAKPPNGIFIPPLIAVESPRPYPLGSVFSTHGGPDNGVNYVPILNASMSSESIRPLLQGSSWVASTSELVLGPTLQIVPFSVNLFSVIPFTMDMGSS